MLRCQDLNVFDVTLSQLDIACDTCKYLKIDCPKVYYVY